MARHGLSHESYGLAIQLARTIRFAIESDNNKRGLNDELSAERWTDAVRELGRDLPWHTRRANVLSEGIDLASTIGQRLRIGEVEIEVYDETRPCKLMDEACPGLRLALKPDKRGGVVGEVVRGGVIRVGGVIVALARPARASS